ncbi:hypothetical protein [Fibrobacter sp. UWH6]|uniref:hypothetical protein n=1 Tax=Fibrobacter sp. (strain UWH6) TaxID=1896212 RepID=UPI001114BB53|nr:hypothetical protein [Fibrobacter sp. UWH6]
MMKVLFLFMNTINRYFPCLTAVALFFCFHHYGGIILDAILYLLQYVHSVSPERFLGDPPIDFGNQDSFGFFSPLLGAFVKSLGVDVGMKIMCALSHLGWCIAVILLINSITRFFKSEKYFLFGSSSTCVGGFATLFC